MWRSDMGRLFQNFGPTCENVRSPQVCLIRGNCKVCEVDERRLREGYVCRHLGYLVGKKEQACAMRGIQGGES